MNDQQAKREEIRKHYEAFQEWVKERAKDAALCSETDYRKLPEYQKALKYFQEFEHKEDVDYSAVVDFARKLHEWMEKTDDKLDEKADSIIKYLSGGSALITLAALLSVKLDSPNTIKFGLVILACLIPSLVAAVASIYFAIKVRIPQPNASPPPIPDAVTIAELYQGKEKKLVPEHNVVELNLWLILNPICEVAYFRNKTKAGHVKVAHRLYLVSIALLVSPLIGGAIRLYAFLP